MIARHAFIYIGARIFAAVLNLVSVALFARLAGPSVFGEYLLFQAAAFIVYGFTFQWLRMAFFAAYDANHSDTSIATFVQATAASLTAATILGLLAASLDLIALKTCAGILIAALGLAIFDCFYEIARARLRAGLIGRSVVVRAVLMPIGGFIGFELSPGALGLTAGVATSQLVAALILIWDVRSKLSLAFSRANAAQLLGYGSPLIAAFGVNAAGQTIDRLLLARFESVTAMGPYGAVGDVIKQGLLVTCEAIAGSYIPHAKVAHNERNESRLRDVLGEAFRVYALITMFGAAVILTFAPEVIRIMFGDDYARAADGLIPLFAAANVLFAFRAFYFGQAIYFLDNASMELKTSVATVATSATVSMFLIPIYGTFGAAAGLLAGQAAGCAVAMYNARQCRAMPYPVGDFLAIAGIAIIAAFFAKAATFLPIGAAGIVLVQGTVIAIGAAAVTLAFNIFGLGERATQVAVLRRLAPRRG